MRHRAGDRARGQPVPRVGVAAAGGQQAEQVGLAGAVGAEHSDPVTEPDLEVERLHQRQPGRGVEREPLAHHGPLAGPGTAQPHGDALLQRDRLRRPGLLELP